MAGYFTDKRTKNWWKPIFMDGVLRNTSGQVQVPQLSQVYSYRSGQRSTRAQGNEEILLSAQQPVFKTSFDNGHEFSSKKQEFSVSHPSIFMAGRNGHYYRGPLLCWSNADIPVGVATFGLPGSIQSTYYGGLAISNTRPTRPRADISQFLGEINRLPTFFVKGNAFRDYVDVARFVGDQYLNLAFGWLPFISDLQKYVSSLLDLQEQYNQYIRDNGRVVRRRWDLDPLVETKTLFTKSDDSTVLSYLSSSDAFDAAGYYANFGDDRGKVSVIEESSQTYKFSGAYTYFLNPRDDLLGKMDRQTQLARKLLGVDLTPALLWELAPWSWLADWHANIGIALSNYTAFQRDGLVLRYGYLQRETVIKRTVSVEGIKFRNLTPGVISNTFTTTWKERVRASPYGFALNPTNYSPFQWAILAALGMTKAGGILRRY